MRIRLTDAQARIVESLQPAGEIAKIFEAGALLRNDAEFPGRAYLLGHAMRETLNRLPDYYQREPTASDIQKNEERFDAHQLNDLFMRWKEAVGSRFETIEGTIVPEEIEDLSIPFTVALQIDLFLRGEASVERTLHERLTAVLASVQNTDPSFMGDIARGLMRLEPDRLAHLPKPQDVRDEAETLQKWDQFESILLGLYGARHQRYTEISQELDRWNNL